MSEEIPIDKEFEKSRSPLDDEFTDRPQLIKKRAVAYFIGEVVRGLTLLGVVITLFYVVASLHTAEESRDRLIECTVPGNECYDEGQARTGDAIEQIVDGTRVTVIATVACSKQFNKFQEIELCVKETLREVLHSE